MRNICGGDDFNRFEEKVLNTCLDFELQGVNIFKNSLMFQFKENCISTGLKYCDIPKYCNVILTYIN